MGDESQGAIEQVIVSVLPDGRMNRNETARYLGVAPQTLASWASRNFGPRVVKIGGRAFYWRSEVDAFIAASAAEPA